MPIPQGTQLAQNDVDQDAQIICIKELMFSMLLRMVSASLHHHELLAECEKQLNDVVVKGLVSIVVGRFDKEEEVVNEVGADDICKTWLMRRNWIVEDR
ncbi:hypothetical protein BC936DRAFT_146451 [Jimgerdemannia flammicorona]|uniref:Uncharacterized protein n=1 Tax=Jimgerdemannia flammicorona TaxID=994334 RepID=A0A433D7K8_9FUNG|nr:hypothetical protein BC936DRAFT_146451 [Jimgerdemannia flammicorona]